VQAICGFIHENIPYHIDGWDTPASETLRKKYGMCANVTNLAVALCRGLGIPARFVSVGIHKNAFTHDVMPSYFDRMRPLTRHYLMQVYQAGYWQDVHVDLVSDPGALVKAYKKIYASKDAILAARKDTKSRGLGNDGTFRYLNRIYWEKINAGRAPAYLPSGAKIIFIAGLIGSGVTAVSAMVEIFALTAAKVISLDEIRRAIFNQIKAEASRITGKDISADDGSVDYYRVESLMMKDKEVRDALIQVIGARIQEVVDNQVSDALAAGHKYILIKAGLFPQIDFKEKIEELWIVETTEQERFGCLKETRPVSQEDIRALTQYQKPILEELKAKAKIYRTINNITAGRKIA